MTTSGGAYETCQQRDIFVVVRRLVDHYFSTIQSGGGGGGSPSALESYVAAAIPRANWPASLPWYIELCASECRDAQDKTRVSHFDTADNLLVQWLAQDPTISKAQVLMQLQTVIPTAEWPATFTMYLDHKHDMILQDRKQQNKSTH